MSGMGGHVGRPSVSTLPKPSRAIGCPRCLDGLPAQLQLTSRSQEEGQDGKGHLGSGILCDGGMG